MLSVDNNKVLITINTYITPVRMKTINKTKQNKNPENKCWQGCREIALLVGKKMVQPLWNTVG